MIMVIKRVEYGISYYDLIKENFHAQIYPFSPVCVHNNADNQLDMRTYTELISITDQLKYLTV